MATFTQGDYTYTTLTSNTVKVSLVDPTKTTYELMPSTVMHQGVTYAVTNMDECFYNCVDLTVAPQISKNITTMRRGFSGCSELVVAPIIPKTVTNMSACFENCVKLTGDIYIYAAPSIYNQAFFGTIKPITLHPMDNNINRCELIAGASSNDNVYVNVRPQEPTTFTDTEMNYKTEDGFIVVSPQTHSDVVQCEVPDLVNGGTVTTNVNDALMDLTERIGSTVEYIFWKQFGGLTYTRKDNEVIISGKPQNSNAPICKYTALSNATYKIIINTNIPSNIGRCFYQVGDTGGIISYSPNATVSLRKGDTLTLYIYWSSASSSSMTNFTFKPKLVKL